jgi:S-adenosylmethionine:tRNA ribosyltransferase-isomerase
LPINFGRVKTDEFDFEFPESQIALTAAPRGLSRMVTVQRGAAPEQPHAVAWGSIGDIASRLSAGDALVLNDTRVLRARLRGQTPQGGRFEALLLKPVDDAVHPLLSERGWRSDEVSVWEAMVKPGKRFRVGDTLQFGPLGESKLAAEVLAVRPDGTRWLAFHLEAGAFFAALEKWGDIPLPPYIDRATTPEDAERYQSVFAEHLGSVAAPTASLHFDEALLSRLEAQGVRLIRVTLHVGAGTFKPVESEWIADHPMHSETYRLTETAAEQVRAVKASGGRVLAVGTTAARVLESCSSRDEKGGFRIQAGVGETRLFITPGYDWKAVDGLLTNFHWPKSTLFMLVSSLLGLPETKRIYADAIQRGFRLFSYGDAMLIL